MKKIVEYRDELASEFLELYRDCRQFYQMEPAGVDVENHLIRLLSSQRFIACILAYADNIPVGFSTWTLTLPAGEGPALYIKEIYVTKQARSQGIGRDLMRSLVEIARQHECSRIDWTTDSNNDPARQFYRNLNVSENTDKVFYRVTNKQFSEFDNRLAGGGNRSRST